MSSNEFNPREEKETTMKSLSIIHLVALFFLASTNVVMSKPDCTAFKYVLAFETTNEVDELTCLKQENENLKNSLDLQLLLLRDMGEFLREMLERHVSKDFENVGDLFGSFFWGTAMDLNYKKRFYNKKGVEALRAFLASSEVTKMTYRVVKPVVIGFAKDTARFEMIQKWLEDAAPLFKKPLNFGLGREAGDWYGNHCNVADMVSNYNKKTCLVLADFSERFQKYYGTKPTRSNVWILSFLFRRFLEGGIELVKQYQIIGNEMHSELVKSTGTITE